MQTQNTNDSRNKSNRVWAGLFLLLVGGIFFLREADIPFFPDWIFSWPMILIAVGVFTGIRHQFRGAGWLIPMVIGFIFLFDEMNIGFDMHRFIVPVIIISIGLMMILRPKHRNRGPYGKWDKPDQYNYPKHGYTDMPADTVSAGTQQQDWQSFRDNSIDVTSVLGNTHRVVSSKNFQGGDVTCFMGGAEIDLSQADISGQVVMDVTAVMGGCKLIVPTNWEVKPEITNVLGGVEDKRQLQGKVIDFNKVLVLKGTTFMGGIELRSF